MPCVVAWIRWTLLTLSVSPSRIPPQIIDDAFDPFDTTTQSFCFVSALHMLPDIIADTCLYLIVTRSLGVLAY